MHSTTARLLTIVPCVLLTAAFVSWQFAALIVFALLVTEYLHHHYFHHIDRRSKNNADI